MEMSSKMVVGALFYFHFPQRNGKSIYLIDYNISLNVPCAGRCYM